MADRLDELLREMSLVFPGAGYTTIREEVVSVLSYLESTGQGQRMPELHEEYRRMIERFRKLSKGAGERSARLELEVLCHAADISPLYDTVPEAISAAAAEILTNSNGRFVLANYNIGPIRRLYRTSVDNALKIS